MQRKHKNANEDQALFLCDLERQCWLCLLGPRRCVAVPILFEALPTKADKGREGMADHVEQLLPLAELGLEAINVPEIINGHYQTVDPREFALALQDRLEVPVILNRISVYHSAGEMEAWAEETRDMGIKQAVIVGGESSKVPYPGIGVLEALDVVSPVMDRTGVITIPSRRGGVVDEPERLLAKQEAGASFAISQILMECLSAGSLQRDLATSARRRDMAQPLLYWSLAPIQRKRDISFLKWLGVEAPAGIEAWFREAPGSKERGERSLALNLELAKELLENANGTTGFCVEHVMAGNVGAAVTLVEALRRVCQDGPPRATGAGRPIMNAS